MHYIVYKNSAAATPVAPALAGGHLRLNLDTKSKRAHDTLLNNGRVSLLQPPCCTELDPGFMEILKSRGGKRDVFGLWTCLSVHMNDFTTAFAVLHLVTPAR